MPDGRDATTPAESMWNLRTLAECLLDTPKGAPINEGLARDLARAALDGHSALRYIEQRYGRLDGVGWERVLGV